MSRMHELEQRRARLIARSGRQREELAGRLAQLKGTPLSQAAAQMFGPRGGGETLPFVGPLAWAAALAGLLLLRRPRQVLTLLAWARTALSVGSRAAMVLRMFGQLRRRRAGTDSPEPRD
jgi:hypothetical protein